MIFILDTPNEGFSFMKKNEIYKVKVEDITFEGFGVARAENIVLFIPNAIKDDVILAKVLKLKKNYAYAKIEEIVKESPARIPHDCDCFEKCGGCIFRNISYSDELKIKQNHIKQTLSRIANLDNINLLNIIKSPESNFYRNKVMLPIRETNGKINFGFFKQKSHNFVPLKECYLQPEIFTKILNFIINYMQENKIPAYDEANGSGVIRNIYLRRSSGEILLCIVVNKSDFNFKQDFINELTQKFKEIVGIVLNFNLEQTNVVLGKNYKTIYGRDYIYESLLGYKFKISADSFFQVNTKQTENLYKKACEFASLKGNETLLDLYCGTGTIGLTMANRAKELIGVEINESAIKNAKENAKINKINNAKFYCIDAKNAFKIIKEENKLIDTVILDPPRKGINNTLINDISNNKIKKVVYISCNVATLARDLKGFLENGYKINKIQPFDMFPRTGHVEAVCLLTHI